MLYVLPALGSTARVPSNSQLSSVSAEPSAASDPVMYKVTIDNGSVSKEYLVEAGESITFSVGTPSDDCLEFVKWSDGITDKHRSIQVHGNFTISAIFEMVKFTNTNANADSSKAYVDALYAQLDKMAEICGLILEKKVEILDEEIEKLIQERQDARKAKNFARADEIRNQLLEQGIVLEDTREGVKWKRA